MPYDRLEYIRTYYQVPATKGRIVRHNETGRLGVITGASGPHTKVRLDGEKNAYPYHPLDFDYNIVI